ncbi:recombinase family protein [Aureispira]|nr:recombinase family protein [Aureispira sp.]
MNKNTYRNKISDDDRKELNSVISELRVEKSLSLNLISRELNDRGYLTPTNKKWNKPNLSLYLKRKKLCGKVEGGWIVNPIRITRFIGVGFYVFIINNTLIQNLFLFKMSYAYNYLFLIEHY